MFAREDNEHNDEDDGVDDGGLDESAVTVDIVDAEEEEWQQEMDGTTGSSAMDEMEEEENDEEKEEEVGVAPLRQRVGRAITDIEYEWTIELIEAAEAHEEEEQEEEEEKEPKRRPLLLTDFEYAKAAIVSRGDTEAALEGIQQMKVFCDYYGVDNSVDQGLHYLEAMMRQQPGFLLHFDVNDNHEAIFVMDAGRLNRECLKSDHHWKDLILGMYYLHLVIQPTTKSIRQGYYALVDFGDISGENNFKNVEVQYRICNELGQYYPFKCHKFMAFHTGVMAHTRISLVKAFMPQHLKEKIEVGCQIEENHESRNPTNLLKHFYLQPNLDEAYKNLLARARVLLEHRAHNEQLFSLE